MSLYEMMVSGQLDSTLVEDTETYTNGDAGFCGLIVVQEAIVDTAVLGRNTTGSMNGWTLPTGLQVPLRIESFSQANALGRVILLKGAGRP
jgi:hypothetical protein